MYNIDLRLDEVFVPERFIREYWNYKESKRDLFSSADDPSFAIVMGADGVKYEAFEKQLDCHALNICGRIHEGKYLFYPFREIDIPKEKLSTPLTSVHPPDDLPITHDDISSTSGFRTLGIASIRDAIVQRLIYEVLYESVEAIFRCLDNPFPVSFAYRKGKSAPKAAVSVHEIIQSGYWCILDADISKYFDTISHNLLLEKLSNIIDPTSRTFDLVRRFVHTDRVPYSSYRYARRKGNVVGARIFHWRKPERVRREQGIAQGGVLSGMLANLYLHDFDLWVINELGSLHDIRYIRYADDFIILTKALDILPNIQTVVQERLEALGLRLNVEKTRHIDVRNTPLEFVGFQFDGEHLRVRPRNIAQFKDRVLEAICMSSDQTSEKEHSQKRAMKRLKRLASRVEYKIKGYSGSQRCPVCNYERVGSPRSWIAFFRVVTDKSQIRQLDKWIREQIYEDIFSRYRVRLDRRKLKQAGLHSLVNESYRVRHTRMKPCICDLKRDGLETYVQDLYEAKYFKTLVEKKSFRVGAVSSTGLEIRIKGSARQIPLADLLDAWEKLRRQGNVTRLELESCGIRLSSQVVTLLCELPGVAVADDRPICLKLDPNVQRILAE